MGSYIDAEQSVLGGIMLDNAAMQLVKSLVQPDDFGEPQHRLIFAAMLELDRTQHPIDEVTVTNQMRALGTLEPAGGPVAVTTLVERIPTAANITAYANIVRRAGCARMVYRAVQKAARDLANTVDLDEVLADLAAAQNVATMREPDRFEDLADEYADIMREMQQRHETGTAVSHESFVPTGYAELDHKIIGFGAKQLIVLSAGSGVGKTAMALNFSSRQALSGYRVGFLSGEMDKRAVARRLFACTAPVNHHTLRAGLFSTDEWDRAANAIGRMKRSTFLVNDTINSIDEACGLLTRAHMMEPLAVGYIDYLQHLVPHSGRENREQAVAGAIKKVKNTARKLGIPIVVLSQLNKDGGLRESEAIFHASDIVMQIDREEGESEATLTLKKQRDGGVGSLKLEYRGHFLRFEEPNTIAPPPRAQTSWLEKTETD